MSLTAFLAGTFIISLSGVLAPGPITAVTLGEGSRSPRAGLFIALGHGTVELPVMAGVAAGLGYLVAYPGVKYSILIFGGILLLLMAADMIRRARQSDMAVEGRSGRPFVSGMLLTAGNPYFLIWWATIGAALLVSAREFGITGIVLFAVVHWLCDFLWLASLSWLASRGGSFFGDRFQRGVFWLCGVFLVFFGGWFIVSAVMEMATA